MSKKNSKVQFNHKSDNIFIPITPTINQDVQTVINIKKKN